MSNFDEKPEQDPIEDQYEKRNFRLALINGILIRTGFRFTNSRMVLAAFVKQLTGSNIMVGLTSSTMRAGSVWPQLFTSNLIEHRSRKMPFYILGSAMRIASWILIMLLVILMGDRDYLLLFVCFYFLYFIANSSIGISSIPFSDIVAKSIPSERRARLFSLRSSIGGIFSIGAGFVIRYILSDEFYLSFPYNYACMFGITVVMLTAATISFALSKEPIHPVRDTRQPFWEHLKGGASFIKTDRGYRHYIILRMIASLGAMCIPFYIPYALDKIGLSASIIGTYTAAGAISGVLSNLLWAYIGEKYGSKYLIIVNSSLACIPPLFAACVRYLPASHHATLYSLVFILTQAFISGRGIGYMTYTLNLAPSINRPTYLGFLNTMMFPMSFVPVLGGLLLKIMSYEAVFILSSIISIITVYFAVKLSEVDK